jgi:DNA-binding XRE family transcriptional regulator
LRFDAAHGVWRVAFAFDPKRNAVLPIAGDNIAMPVTLKDKMKELSPAQCEKVEARAAELIAEEMTLRELRHARKLTQVKMAKTLGVTQDSVSRIEKRSDLLLSTLRKTVEAMGGNLSLVAEFPDRAPVVLSGIAADDPQPKPRSRRRVA